MGDYERIYPIADTEEDKKYYKEPYEDYMEITNQFYKKFTGMAKKERIRSSVYTGGYHRIQMVPEIE